MNLENNPGSEELEHYANKAHAAFEEWSTRRHQIVDTLPMLKLLELYKAAVVTQSRIGMEAQYRREVESRLQSIRMYCYSINMTEEENETELLYTMLADLDQYITFYTQKENQERFMPSECCMKDSKEFRTQHLQANRSLAGVEDQRVILNDRIIKRREARAMAILHRPRLLLSSQLHKQLDDEILEKITRHSLNPSSTRTQPFHRPTLYNDLS